MANAPDPDPHIECIEGDPALLVRQAVNVRGNRPIPMFQVTELLLSDAPGLPPVENHSSVSLEPFAL